MHGGSRPGAGRKKGFSAIKAEEARAYIARRITQEQKPIIDRAIEQAKEGDGKAREWLYERGFGRLPASSVEVQAQPLNVRVIHYGGGNATDS